MKRLLFILLFLPLFSKADHISGVDFYYRHISGNTYGVYMAVYANCGQDNYDRLPDAQPKIHLVDSAQGTNNIISTFYLSLSPDTVEISPYCNAEKNNTTCSTPRGLLPGYKRFIYSDTITLPYKSSKWIFRFSTSTKTGSACGNYFGRPKDVINLNDTTGPSQAIGLEAMLDNTLSDNNSPSFNNSVFTAYCINSPSMYSQGVSELDGDSLVFASITPVISFGSTKNNNPDVRKCDGSPLFKCIYTYNSGLSPSNPFYGPTGSYNFDASTGNISFTANRVGSYTITTRVYEYRNGKLIGYVTRDKEFKVLSGCTNTAPSGIIDTSTASLSGGKWTGTNSIMICPDQTIQFKIPLTDASGDTIKASVLSLPPGATATITNNNSQKPVINFSWNTTGLGTGFYSFTCFYTDNGCPFPSSSQFTYNIEISDIGYMKGEQLSITNCVLDKAQVNYTYHNYFNRKYYITLSQGNTILKIFKDSVGVINDSLPVGTYNLVVTDSLLSCVGTNTFTVYDNGKYPYSPIADSTPLLYCKNAFANPLIAKKTGLGDLKWYDENHTSLNSSAPLPKTNVAGTFTYYVTEKYKDCESDPDSVSFTITPDECDYDIKIYNAITPNGDSKNDMWVIHNIDIYPNNLVQVFSKDGSKVFEQKGYQNNWMGGNLPSGVYYYLINLNEKNKATGLQTYTGFLMITR